MKHLVHDWESVATYVATYSENDGLGAANVEVCIGEDSDGEWHLHTRDDAGGDDEAPSTSYATRADAVVAAEALAAELDEGDGEDADEYLRRQLADQAGEPCTDGEWACYWDSACTEDCGPRRRYESQEAAQAAVDLANEELAVHNPGGNLLCAFEVRQLVDGEWVIVYPPWP